MAFHFPVMPRLFMALRREDATPIVEILDQTPRDPRLLPVGPLPAQPRRADARDGDRGGARIHVRRVRDGPAGETEHRHPPAAGAAARQRPRRDRADDRDPLHPARQPDHLLRRRDRDGGQRLPRRPRRGAHADAVDRRPQRRLLHRRLRPDVRAALDGPGLRLRGGQRRGAAAHADLAAALDAPLHRPAQGAPGLRPRRPARRRARTPGPRTPASRPAPSTGSSPNRPGSRPRSSTRSTCAASSTATATGWATSAA